MNTTFALHMNPVETEILQLWMKQASETTWMHAATREAMVEFSRKIQRAISAQCPALKITGEFGNFS